MFDGNGRRGNPNGGTQIYRNPALPATREGARGAATPVVRTTRPADLAGAPTIAEPLQAVDPLLRRIEARLKDHERFVAHEATLLLRTTQVVDVLQVEPRGAYNLITISGLCKTTTPLWLAIVFGSLGSGGVRSSGINLLSDPLIRITPNHVVDFYVSTWAAGSATIPLGTHDGPFYVFPFSAAAPASELAVGVRVLESFVI